jgi:hypothetical protein
MHAAGSIDRWRARNQRVLEVIDEFRHGPAEVALPKRNHPLETFLFDRSHEAFRVRIGIRRLERCLHDVEAGLIQQPSNLPTPLPIPIADQHAVAAIMRYNFRFTAIVSVLLAVAAMVQGVSGEWLYLGVAMVTVALEILTRRDDEHQFFSRESSRRGPADATDRRNAASRGPSRRIIGLISRNTQPSGPVVLSNQASRESE